MSIQNKAVHANEQILDFYTKNLQNFGSTSQGVGWKNDYAQFTRFEQLTKIFADNKDFSINDLGCGTGKYLNFLFSKGYLSIAYHGYDILEEMIALAKQSLQTNNKIRLTRIAMPKEMELADYTIASGIFNIKYNVSESDWLENITATLEAMNDNSNLGFAFNLLTKYSDKEFMQNYLYYADPLFLFDYCKRNFSKNVALLHDYDQYDFTILVRKAIL